MRRFTLTLLATTAAIGLAASAAAAPDLPRKAPAPVLPPPPPPYNWTGFYLGGFFGAGWVRNDLDNTNIAVSNDFVFSGGSRAISSGLGPLGGVTVGWNWQLPNAPIVLGIEGDFAWGDLKGSADRNATRTDGFNFCNVFLPLVGCVNSGSQFTVANASARTNFKVRDMATITGRFGLISGPQDRTLWYVKGGGAWARTNVDVTAQVNAVQCSINDLFVGNPSPFDCFSREAAFSFSNNFNKWGWTVGTGLEFGLWDNWTGKVEYDFLQFGSRTFNFATGSNNQFGDPIFVNTQVKEQIHQIKIGLNYRFNWGRY